MGAGKHIWADIPVSLVGSSLACQVVNKFHSNLCCVAVFEMVAWPDVPGQVGAWRNVIRFRPNGFPSAGNWEEDGEWSG